MSARIPIAVIGGGGSAEHEVSLASAAAAAAVLDPGSYLVRSFTITRTGGWLLDQRALRFPEAMAALAACELALPLVHGAPGEDGALAALCELAGVPYAGSGVSAAAIAMDKHATKLLAAAVGVRTAPAVLIERRAGQAAAPSGPPLPLPLVVKPVSAGSSRGVTPVREPKAWPGALEDAFAYGERVLAEQLVEGREIDIAVLEQPDGELLVSPPLEIHSAGFFDYDAKYGGETRFEVPAPLNARQLGELERAARTVYRALGCAGLVRLDFFLDQDGWLLNEVNTTPGMTAHSQVPRMYAAMGISYPQLLELMLAGARGGRHPRG